MDASELHRAIGALTAEQRATNARLDRVLEDFACVPERLNRLEDWRAFWDERERRLGVAKWTIGGSVVMLAIKEAWDWLHHLFVGRA